MTTQRKPRTRSGKFSPAAEAKLLSSGISLSDAEKLGIEESVSAQQWSKSFSALPALRLNYYDVKKNPARSHPKYPPFYRIRYLGAGKEFSDVAKTKTVRYAQEYESGVCAYFPRVTDWEKLRKDSSEAVLFTEGELKAAKATLEGFPTIGLGGVYNFMSAKNGVFFLPELEAFNWIKRNVFIIYDSDSATNSMVCAAINRLAEELQERGALVFVAFLPNTRGEDEKTGLDDFLVDKGAEALSNLLRRAEPLGISRALWKTNEQIAYVEDPGFVVDLASYQEISVNSFMQHSRWSTLAAAESEVDENGNVKVKKSAVSKVWIKWPLRKSCKAVTYKPGEKQITEGNEFNQWRGWGCAPRKGNHQPFVELCEFIFKDAGKEPLEWFYDWLAYPLQFPGTKMFTCVVVHGVVHGTGKSLIGYTMGEIYGTNFKELKSEELHGTFSAWAKNRQFILGDEITGSDRRNEADALKRLITQKTVTINIKHIPEYTIPDCINYYFTSNHPEAFFLEDTDRRYFVNEVIGAPKPIKWYEDYGKWLAGEGPSAVFDWLLKRNLKNFNPAAHAPITSAKHRMISDSKSDVGTWVATLLRSPNEILRVGQMRYMKDLFTSRELFDLYQAQSATQGRVTINGLGRELRKAGVPLAYRGAAVPLVNGPAQRLYIVRNAERWQSLGNAKSLAAEAAKTPVSDRKR